MLFENISLCRLAAECLWSNTKKQRKENRIMKTIKLVAPIVAIFTTVREADHTAERWLKKRFSWWRSWYSILLVAMVCSLATGMLVLKYQRAIAMPTPPAGVTQNTYWTYETKWKYSFGMDAIHIVRGTTEFQVFRRKGKSGPYRNDLSTTYEEFLQNSGLKGQL